MSFGALMAIVGGGLILAYYVQDWMNYRMRARRRRELDESGWQKHMSYDWRVYAVAALSILLGLLFRQAPLLTLYIWIVGLWWALYMARKEKISERMLINEQVYELSMAFRSVFRIRPTVFSALEEANRKIEAPLGRAVAHAVSTFYITSLPQRAYAELRQRIQNPYSDQLIYILERAEDAKHEDIMQSLQALVHRLRRARELRNHSEVNMTVINSQTRMIQMISIILVFAVAIIPAMRRAYTDNMFGQFLFMVVASIAIGTSYVIDRRSLELREKVL